MVSDEQKARLRKAALRKLRHGDFFLNVDTGELTIEEQLVGMVDIKTPNHFPFGDFWRKLSRSDQRQLVRKAKYARLRNMEVNHTVYLVTGIGRGVWLSISLCYVDDESATFLVGSVRDVTREQIIVGELEKTANFFESIVENIPNMIFVKEAKDLRFVRLNKAGEKLFGMKNARVLGKNDYDFFPREQADFFTAKDRYVLDSGVLEVIEEEPIDSAEGRRYLRTKKMPVFDHRGRPLFLLGISEDITEQKASEELIKEQREALLHASKMSALGEMAGGIAHEINNPLAIMRGYADYMIHFIENTNPPSKDLVEYCHKILQTTDRIARIIRGLRGFARDGADDPMLPVNVKTLIDNTLEFCRERFKYHNVEVRLVTIPELEIVCQETQISQVLLNILNNAFDAVVNLDQAWVSIEVTKAKSQVIIKVRDSGAGIPSEIKDKVMLPFFTTKEVGKGTGLGLSISKGIIESHYGELYFDGSESTTCIVIKLPVDPNTARQAS